MCVSRESLGRFFFVFPLRTGLLARTEYRKNLMGNVSRARTIKYIIITTGFCSFFFLKRIIRIVIIHGLATRSHTLPRRADTTTPRDAYKRNTPQRDSDFSLFTFVRTQERYKNMLFYRIKRGELRVCVYSRNRNRIILLLSLNYDAHNNNNYIMFAWSRTFSRGKNIIFFRA